MTSAEMVTDFKIRTDVYETPMGCFDNRADANARCEANDMLPELCVKHRYDMASLPDFIKAINAFCGDIAEEYNFSCGYQRNDRRTIPAGVRRLIAYAVEGSNEGYYVHIAAILDADEHRAEHSKLVSLAIAKTYSADSAYELAKQATRFISAAMWN